MEGLLQERLWRSDKPWSVLSWAILKRHELTFEDATPEYSKLSPSDADAEAEEEIASARSRDGTEKRGLLAKLCWCCKSTNDGHGLATTRSRRFSLKGGQRPPRDMRYAVEIVVEDPSDSLFVIGFSSTRPFRRPERGQDGNSESDAESDGSNSKADGSQNENENEQDNPLLKNFGGISNIEYIEFQARNPVDKQAWVDCLEPFDLVRSQTAGQKPEASSEEQALRKRAGLPPVSKSKTCIYSLPAREYRALSMLLAYLKDNGVCVRNLFRQTHSAEDLAKLVRKLIVDEVKEIPVGYDASGASSALQTLLHRTPETMLTTELFSKFVRASDEKDYAILSTLIQLLPPANREVLTQLAFLCNDIQANRAETRMDIRALGLTLGLALLPWTDPDSIRDYESTAASLFQDLVACVTGNKALGKDKDAHGHDQDSQHRLRSQSQQDIEIELLPEADADRGEEKVLVPSERVVGALRNEVRDKRQTAEDGHDEDEEIDGIGESYEPIPRMRKAQTRDAWPTAVFQQCLSRARPVELFTPSDFSPWDGFCKYLPFALAQQFIDGIPSRSGQEALGTARSSDSVVEEVDLDPSVEAGACFPSSRSVARRRRPLFGTDTEAAGLDQNQQRPRTAEQVVAAARKEGSSVHPHEIVAPSINSPSLAGPSILALALGSKMGVVPRYYKVNTSIFPLAPSSSISSHSTSSLSTSCFGFSRLASLTKSISIGTPSSSAALPEFDGPLYRLATAQLLWTAIVALRKRIKDMEAADMDLANEVADLRHVVDLTEARRAQKELGIGDYGDASTLGVRHKVVMRPVLTQTDEQFTGMRSGDMIQPQANVTAGNESFLGSMSMGLSGSSTPFDESVSTPEEEEVATRTAVVGLQGGSGKGRSRKDRRKTARAETKPRAGSLEMPELQRDEEEENADEQAYENENAQEESENAGDQQQLSTHSEEEGSDDADGADHDRRSGSGEQREAVEMAIVGNKAFAGVESESGNSEDRSDVDQDLEKEEEDDKRDRYRHTKAFLDEKHGDPEETPGATKGDLFQEIEMEIANSHRENDRRGADSGDEENREGDDGGEEEESVGFSDADEDERNVEMATRGQSRKDRAKERKDAYAKAEHDSERDIDEDDEDKDEFEVHDAHGDRASEDEERDEADQINSEGSLTGEEFEGGEHDEMDIDSAEPQPASLGVQRAAELLSGEITRRYRMQQLSGRYVTPEQEESERRRQRELHEREHATKRATRPVLDEEDDEESEEEDEELELEREAPMDADAGHRVRVARHGTRGVAVSRGMDADAFVATQRVGQVDDGTDSASDTSNNGANRRADKDDDSMDGLPEPSVEEQSSVLDEADFGAPGRDGLVDHILGYDREEPPPEETPEAREHREIYAARGVIRHRLRLGLAEQRSSALPTDEYRPGRERQRRKAYIRRLFRKMQVRKKRLLKFLERLDRVDQSAMESATKELRMQDLQARDIEQQRKARQTQEAGTAPDDSSSVTGTLSRSALEGQLQSAGRVGGAASAGGAQAEHGESKGSGDGQMTSASVSSKPPKDTQQLGQAMQTEFVEMMDVGIDATRDAAQRDPLGIARNPAAYVTRRDAPLSQQKRQEDLRLRNALAQQGQAQKQPQSALPSAAVGLGTDISRLRQDKAGASDGRRRSSASSANMLGRKEKRKGRTGQAASVESSGSSDMEGTEAAGKARGSRPRGGKRRKRETELQVVDPERPEITALKEEIRRLRDLEKQLVKMIHEEKILLQDRDRSFMEHFVEEKRLEELKATKVAIAAELEQRLQELRDFRMHDREQRRYQSNMVRKQRRERRRMRQLLASRMSQEDRPWERDFDASAAMLAAGRAELEDLKWQLRRLLLELEAVMEGFTDQWRQLPGWHDLHVQQKQLHREEAIRGMWENAPSLQVDQGAEATGNANGVKDDPIATDRVLWYSDEAFIPSASAAPSRSVAVSAQV